MCMAFVARDSPSEATAVEEEMFVTAVRLMAKKPKPKMKPIELNTPQEQTQTITRAIFEVVKEHGPLTIADTWDRVKGAGLIGLSSKRHMKILMRWMRERQKLRKICNHDGPHKQFLYTTWFTKPKTMASTPTTRNSSKLSEVRMDEGQGTTGGKGRGKAITYTDEHRGKEIAYEGKGKGVITYADYYFDDNDDDDDDDDHCNDYNPFDVVADTLRKVFGDDGDGDYLPAVIDGMEEDLGDECTLEGSDGKRKRQMLARLPAEQDKMEGKKLMKYSSSKRNEDIKEMNRKWDQEMVRYRTDPNFRPFLDPLPPPPKDQQLANPSPPLPLPLPSPSPLKYQRLFSPTPPPQPKSSQFYYKNEN